MGFRFRRTIKLLPGLRLNIGKKGVSASMGIPGAQVTINKKTMRTTVGLPGTGLSHTTQFPLLQNHAGSPTSGKNSPAGRGRGVRNSRLVFLVFLFVFSFLIYAIFAT